MSDRGAIEVIARALVVRRGCVLTCWNLKAGYAYLPGGHVEFSERASVALARELVEELGVRSRVGVLALVHENAFDTAKRRHHELNLVFHVELGTGRSKSAALPPLVSREPGIGFEWTPISRLGSIDLRPAIIRDWIVAGARATSVRRSGAACTSARPWPRS